MSEFISTPMWITEYKVRQISDDGFMIEGSFKSTVKGIGELGRIQDTWACNQPMFINNVAETVALIADVGAHMSLYLTSPDPAHRAVAQAIGKIINDVLEKEQGSI